MGLPCAATLAALALLAAVVRAVRLGHRLASLPLQVLRGRLPPKAPAVPLPVLGPEDLWARAQAIGAEMARPKRPGGRYHIEEELPALSVVEADLGRYNGCDRGGRVPVFHVALAGHLRTFHLHSGNLRSFLARSSACWLLSLFVHDELDKKFSPQPGKWSSPNTEAAVARLQQRGESVRSLLLKGREALGGTNVAYMIANFGSWVPNVRGGVAWSAEVARRHGLNISDHDVIAVSRPDVVFSHPVSFGRLHAAALKVPFVLMPRHEAVTIGGNDPSEMLVVGVRRYWESMCLHRQRPGQHVIVSSEPGQQLAPFRGSGCLAPAFSCGHFAPWLVHFANVVGVEAFHYGTVLKLLLHRLTGEWTVGVMRPGKGLLHRPGDAVAERVLDITQSATCTLMTRDSCGKAGPKVPPPKSRCWGQTRHTKINPGYSGFWTCRHKGTVDQCA